MSDLPPPPPSGGSQPPSSPPPPPAGGGYGGGYGSGYVPPPMAGGYPGGGYAMAPRTDGLAIASLVIGILAIVCSIACLGIILGPGAAIMAFISRQRISSSNNTIGGGSLALVGLILGLVGFLISVAWFFFAATHHASTPSAAPTQ